MMIKLSPFGKFSLFALIAVGGVVLWAYSSGENSRAGLLVQDVVDTAHSRIAAHLPEPMRDRNSTSESETEFAYARVRDACFSSMFLEKSGYHFSQSRWGTRPVPYQFRGLELVGPKPAPLNMSDTRNGIDKRIRFQLIVEAYRAFSKEDGWGEWRHESPPELSDIILLRQNGKWKVASAPDRSYSLR